MLHIRLCVGITIDVRINILNLKFHSTKVLALWIWCPRHVYRTRAGPSMVLTSVVEACNNFLLALLAPPVHVAAGVNGWVYFERRGPRRPETYRSPNALCYFPNRGCFPTEILVHWTWSPRHVHRTRAGPSMALTSVVETCNNFLLALLAPPIRVGAGVNGWVYSKTRCGMPGMGAVTVTRH